MRRRALWTGGAAAACALLLVGTAFLSRWAGRDQCVATITVDGVVVRTVDLSAVTEAEAFTIGEPGAQNTIQISPEGIAVVSADCPDQVCVRQGVRAHGPEPIVCLPHRLSIRFSAPGEAELDAVTGGGAG